MKSIKYEISFNRRSPTNEVRQQTFYEKLNPFGKWVHRHFGRRGIAYVYRIERFFGSSNYKNLMKTGILDTNGKEIKTGDRVRAMGHDYTVYYSPITNTFMLDDNNYLSNYESVEII